MLVFLNRLVMKVVSLPTLLNITHFCVGICVGFVIICFLLVSRGGIWVGGWIGKALL